MGDKKMENVSSTGWIKDKINLGMLKKLKRSKDDLNHVFNGALPRISP